METRKLLFAAAALLGAAAVVAQVESPGNMDTDSSVERSTAPAAGAPDTSSPDGEAREAESGFDTSASTATRDASGERPAAEDITPGTERTEPERTDEERESATPARPQAPY